MLNLFVKESESASSVIPVQWTISEDVLEFLKDRGVQNPHLLIVVAKGDYEMNRYLTPLEAGMEYIEFSKAGEQRLLASIVWPESSVGKMKNFFLTRSSSSSYENKVLDYDGDLRSSFYSNNLERAELKINVSEQFFAPEPMDWEKKWVNLWYETKPVNQCQFRRRRMVAYTVQPFAVLARLGVTTLARMTAAAFYLSFGMRRINFKAIFHPWNYECRDVWADVRDYDSVFFRDKDGKEHPFYFAALAPFSLAAMAGIALFAVNSLGLGIVLQLALMMAKGIGYLIGGGLLLKMGARVTASLLGYEKGALSRWTQKWIDRFVDAWEKRMALAWQEKYDNQYKALLTQDAPREKTLMLRYKGLKSMVCRPFAR